MRRSGASGEKQACSSKSNATNPVQKHVRLLAITGEILAEAPTGGKTSGTVLTAKLGVEIGTPNIVSKDIAHISSPLERDNAWLHVLGRNALGKPADCNAARRA